MRKYIIFFILLFIPIFVSALEYPSVNSKYVEVYDLTDDKILYELNSNEKISIASLTKIATTITAIKTIDNLSKQVEITSDILSTVRWDASVAGLKSGDMITYLDLLYASMLPSGADATNSIAILSSGSIENFVEKMNALASDIGLENTHFTNVTGLDDINHYSTASDVIKLLKYSLKDSTFKAIFLTKRYILTNGLKVESTLNIYNKNMGLDTSKIIGSKTGYTKNAMYCLASLINKDDHEIIITTFKGSQIGNKYYNILDTLDLINFINNNYNNQLLVENNTLIKEIPVELSNVDNYKVYSNELIKFLPNDYDKNLINIEYLGLNELSYKNKENEIIGTIKYYYNNDLLKEEKVYLNKKLEFNIIKFINKYIYIILLILLLIFIILVYFL